MNNHRRTRRHRGFKVSPGTFAGRAKPIAAPSCGGKVSPTIDIASLSDVFLKQDDIAVVLPTIIFALGVHTRIIVDWHVS